MIEQMFTITARKEDILETLPYYEHFVPWIKRILICCPQKTKTELQAEYKGKLEMSFITDEELFETIEKPRDHQIRNYMIRALVMKTELLDDVFIMADDDNRPLRKIDETFFVTNASDSVKYNLYYFYEDGHKWHGAAGSYTSYDKGLLNTTVFLETRGLPVKLFSVHAPQVIVKKVYNEALDKYPESIGESVDEWSIYGDYAISAYPDSFVVKPYETMCWPGMPTDWNTDIRPSAYSFENFYRHQYDAGGIFEDFDTVWSEGTEYTNVIKGRIRRRIQDEFDSKKEFFAENNPKLVDGEGAFLDISTLKFNLPDNITVPTAFCAKAFIHLSGMNEKMAMADSTKVDIADDKYEIHIKCTFYGMDGKRPRYFANDVVTAYVCDDSVIQLPIYTPPKSFGGKLRIQVEAGGKKRTTTVGVVII